MRLNRFLALAGIGSRRACEKIIAARRVTVNDHIADSPALDILASDRVRVDGRPLAMVKTATYMLNKPLGVVCTVKDTHGARTVLDLARKGGVRVRLYPVGRLDKNSRGLILLSNHGDLANRLLHPRYEVEKEYLVHLDEPLTPGQMTRFAKGVQLAEGVTAPCRIEPLETGYRIILRQGWKRQIRRMFKALGRDTTDLQRVRIGSVHLGDLAEGELRPLSAGEVDVLMRVVGLPAPGTG
ncbi:rRNA pseudouridine synthase [bacterium]|nr:rRNA pseudouridine synthase [candidate division CSSED10-310 bacterium]